ncbi:KAP-like P-loop domain-containing protein [Cupriavidus gilardii J11]|uniref:KAP-like P-loop domain-containing protein n=1 Tax=Cupriavidus gilardii J11 TaxID=936133 RepID=A0A562BRQ0_9BURK|nr:P-loop NTPase fold protein [Cupriavidus gilardii]TWG87955.1 KAP-like P-loop domain-containing protein [Cupriavidus gilardii J11]
MTAIPARPVTLIPPLVVATPEPDHIQVPFEGDRLNRKAVADRLTGYLERLKVGAVIALDAPWGEGKTWFGRHWTASLRDQGYATGWINAFEQDYVEDAFLPLAAAVLELCQRDQPGSEKVKAGASAVMRALLPVGTKALINLAGRAVGVAGLADEFGEAVKEATAEAAKDGAASVGDAAAAWVERRLEGWGQERATVSHFRQTLAEFAAKQYEASGKPVVIVVDELDRCRPEFAVRLVERIKHFFDVPHLVFVLLMNRDQLEKAIRGVYGSETDAATYLGKFLHLSLKLPKDRTRDPKANPLRAFITRRLQEHGAVDETFVRGFAACAAVFDLSPRDIERGCSLFLLSGSNEAALLKAYLIALKLREPGIYRALGDVAGQEAAHKECCERLGIEVREVKSIGAGLSPGFLPFPGNYFNELVRIHDELGGARRFDESWWNKGGSMLPEILENLRPDTAIKYVMGTLDLDVG